MILLIAMSTRLNIIGGNTTTNKEYYRKISPKIAAIMNLGATGKTSPTVMGLKLQGTEIYATNESHDIVVTSTKNTIFAVSENGKSDIRANTALALEANDFSSVYTLEVAGTEIPANADLNNYTTPGAYYSNNSEITQSLGNCPLTQNGFKLIVEYSQASNRIIQTIKSNDRVNSKSYVRTYVDFWGDWLKDVKEHILYSNTSGTTGNITLSKSIDLFDEVEIFYTVANYNKSIKIPVRTTSLNTTLDCVYVGTSNMVIGSQDCTLSGTTLTRGNSAGKNINLSDNSITNNTTLSFTIYKVIGY